MYASDLSLDRGNFVGILSDTCMFDHSSVMVVLAEGTKRVTQCERMYASDLLLDQGGFVGILSNNCMSDHSSSEIVVVGLRAPEESLSPCAAEGFSLRDDPFQKSLLVDQNLTYFEKWIHALIQLVEFSISRLVQQGYSLAHTLFLFFVEAMIE